MGNVVIMTSFLKIAQQFFVCGSFLLIPIDVLSFKLIKGQIKELQGVVPSTPPWAENDQKSSGRIGLRVTIIIFSVCELYKTNGKINLN